MSCNCHKNIKNFDKENILPDTQCVFCGEKHFSTAYSLIKNNQFKGLNRNLIIGQLVLSAKHIISLDEKLALQLKKLRHLIEYRQQKFIQQKLLEKYF